MNETESKTTSPSDDGDQRSNGAGLRRGLAVLLPLVVVAVLGVGLLSGAAGPDTLAFNDGSSADGEDGSASDEPNEPGSIEPAAVNAPPLAMDDLAATTPSNASVSIAVLDNDSDEDPDVLYVHHAEVLTGQGSVRIVSSGRQLLFTPETGATGPWVVSYVVTDGAEGFDQARVMISNGNRAPEAIDDRASTTTQNTEVIDVGSNDLDDADSTQLQVTSARVLLPAETDATVDVVGGSAISFSSPTLPGTVTVEYTVEDIHGLTDKATVTIDVAAALPVAVDDNATTPEDTAIVVDVLANDGPADLELDVSTLRILTSSSGSASLTSGGIRYDPPPNAVGNAQITYEICSVSTACDTASVFIEVTPVFDESPFAADGQLQIPADAGPQVIPWIVVSSGQTVVTDAMTFDIETDRPDLFVAIPSISSEGILTFDPRPDSTGTANTTITTRDGNVVRTFRLGLVIG